MPNIEVSGPIFPKNCDNTCGNESNLSVCPVGAVSNIIKSNCRDDTVRRRIENAIASSIPGTDPITLSKAFPISVDVGLNVLSLFSAVSYGE